MYNKFRNLATLFILIICFGIAKAQRPDTSKPQDMNAGILYGDNYSYALTAPEGWVLDNNAGRSQGLDAVFYKRGSSWEDGITVMYTNYSTFDTKKGETLQSVIDTDKYHFKTQHSDIVIKKETDIEIGKTDEKKLVVPTYSFYGESYGNYEAVAYIQTVNGAALVVITSRNKDDYTKCYPDFIKLVQSYFWMTDNVNVGK